MLNEFDVPVCCRAFTSEEDWQRVRQLLIETFPITGLELNWEIRHWDGNRYHREGPEWQPELYEGFQLWETADGQLAGLVHPERDDEFCLQIHPDYREQIEDAMLDWAEMHYGKINTDGQRILHLAVFDYDRPRLRRLLERGYERTQNGWIVRRMYLGSQTIPTSTLANGYTLHEVGPHSLDVPGDCQRVAELLCAGFNRPSGTHTAADYLRFITCSPSFRQDLNLFAAAPDGSFAAHAALTYDEENRRAIFEPVCTHPDHRRKGLAQALMFEGIHRIRALGARQVTVATGDAEAANKLYDSLGFTEGYQGRYWRKVFTSEPAAIG